LTYASKAFPAADLESGVHIALGSGGTKPMQGTEAYVEGEQNLEVRIQGKDTREMQDVFSRCRPSFYRTAYRQLNNAADAEDAVQDALLSAHKHLDQFKGQAQMSTWLTTIVMNCARMQLRRRSRQSLLSLDEQFREESDLCLLEGLADDRPSPEVECQESELRRYLMQFVEQLSPCLRKAFQLRDLDGLTIREAAHILGVPAGTVKARLARARAKLKRFMRRSPNVRPCLDLCARRCDSVANE
jgi:RNA polymerase sigma-70 factor (ECF subfamily)